MKQNTQQRGFSLYKTARWVVLAGAVTAIVFALRKPAPPASALAPAQVAEKARSFEAKLEEAEKARQRGDPGGELRLSSEEVSSFVTEASKKAIAGGDGSASGRGAADSDSASPTAAATANTSSNSEPVSVKSTQVAFAGDEVIAQAVTERYGQDIYITVRGKLGAKDGYLTFSPTEFKVGNLSVPVALVDSALQKKLAEPENREKLKLPDFVSDLRIEDGQLVIKQK